MKLRTQSPLWRRIARRLGRRLFQLAEGNEDTRPGRNGEGWLLRQLLAAHARGGAERAFVIFDAGANAGDYTREALASARLEKCDVAVHAFEPSPHCADGLRRSFSAESGVRIIGAAVADRKGETLLYDGRSGSTQASLVPRDVLSGDPAEAITVPLLRLGDYLEEQGIGRIDLLKLDVEGYELAALRGLGGWLRPDCIDVIQFEYGGTAMDAGITLRDLYQLLKAQGYVLGKLFPSALEVRAYQPWMEDFAYANYVALAPRWLGALRPAP